MNYEHRRIKLKFLLTLITSFMSSFAAPSYRVRYFRKNLIYYNLYELNSGLRHRSLEYDNILYSERKLPDQFQRVSVFFRSIFLIACPCVMNLDIRNI